MTLLHGSLTYRDRRLQGFDGAAIVEVIEHLDAGRLPAFERVVFEFARPKVVVLTTPNAEYNRLFSALPAGAMRHADHRFEWTRQQFAEWAAAVADRGPKIASVLRLVMDAVDEGTAICVPGNHEWKLVRKLKGKRVTVSHGLQETLDQLDLETPEFYERVLRFLDGLVSHYVLDGGRIVVAHAGLPESMHGRGSSKVREFALYGETTGVVRQPGRRTSSGCRSDTIGPPTIAAPPLLCMGTLRFFNRNG